MCEGTPPAPQPSQVHPSDGGPGRRRSLPGQNQTRNGSSAVNAVDESPPVRVQIPTWNRSRRRLESSWRECLLVPQTPQLITSLMWKHSDDTSDSDVTTPTTWSPSTAPLLVDHTYLVTATMDGHLCIWNVSEILVSDAVIDASYRVNPRNAPTVTPDLQPKIVSLNQHLSTSNRRTSEAGCVVGMRSYRGTNDSSTHRSSIVVAATDLGVILGVHVATGEVVFCFETQTCGVTSVAIRCIQPASPNKSNDNDDSLPLQQSLQVLVGYDVGVLECWDVVLLLPSSETLTSAQPPAAKSSYTPNPGATTRKEKRRDTSTVAKLVAQGSMESGYAIRTILPLDALPTNVDTVNEPPAPDNNSNDSVMSSEERHVYVMLTLEPERQRSTATMVEVLDLTELQVAWKTATHAARESCGQNGNAALLGRSILELEQYRILPEPGMELSDASLVSSHAPWIATAGANQLFVLYADSNTASMQYAFCLPDGTVCIASAASVEDRLSWGISRRSDQLLLSYPCIGMGEVSQIIRHANDDEDSSNFARFLACGLRGGTVYLVPLIPTAPARDDRRVMHPQAPTIQVFSYPHDVDEDMDVVQHVQGFTAGNVQLTHATGSNSSTDASGNSNCLSSIPIVVYAWPGGILDVYACQLLPGSTAIPRSLVRSCWDNGTIRLLVDILMEQDVSSHGELWTSAKNEVLAIQSLCSDPSKAVEESIQEHGLDSDSLRSFRHLLLHLAAEELQLGGAILG